MMIHRNLGKKFAFREPGGHKVVLKISMVKLEPCQLERQYKLKYIWTQKHRWETATVGEANRVSVSHRLYLEPPRNDNSSVPKTYH